VLRRVVATRYVTPLREGGSLPAIVEADDDGLYVVKFRGAAQGPKALVAEVIVGELARSLGLFVPDLVEVDFDAAIADAEPDPEIQQLLRASGGLNVGLDFLPGSLTFNPAATWRPEPELAAGVVWLDGLVTNPDRTVANPNLLVWHGRLWLIDHGAAMYIHHTWRNPAEHARRPFERIADHVLLPGAASLAEADARLAAVAEASLERVVALVPDDLLDADEPFGGRDVQRRAYVDYLRRRLEAPRPWVELAERGRAA
jgi:hypothetical protein